MFSRQAFKFFLLGKLLALSSEDIESILILFIKLLPKIHNILDPIKDLNVLDNIKLIKKQLEDRDFKRVKDELRAANNQIQLFLRNKKLY